MHIHHNIFAQGIDDRLKVNVTFFSREDGHPLTRKCAPMDYGPSRRAHDKSNRYHLWDYESDERMHVLSMKPDQILKIEATIERFHPAEFVTWQPVVWFYPRDWGMYSGAAAA